MNDDIKARLGGVVCLVIAAGFGWWFILKPYQAALAGAPEISYPLKALVLVPLSLVVGVVGIVFGSKFPYRTADRKNLTPMGWVLFAVIAILTGLCWWWLDAQFKALGYT